MSNAYFDKLFGDEDRAHDERSQDCPEALRSPLDNQAAADDEVVSASQGRIVTRVHSHVGISVTLSRAGSRLDLATAALILILGFLVGCNIYFTFSFGASRADS